MDILIEAFFHQLLPFITEITIPAMLAFGGFEMDEPFRLAVVGALLAGLLLYIFGRLAARYGARFMAKDMDEIAKRFRPIIYMLLLVVASPAGFAVAFAAGLFRAKWQFALPLMLAGICAHYAVVIFGVA